MRHQRLLITAVISASAANAALADDPPAPPPPQNTWIGKGQAGFLDSKGNSNSESINGNIEVWRFDGHWKNDLYLTALYGKNSNIVSAERWEGREQTNYNFAPDLYVFGGLRYEHDLFDGFQYQASISAGLGYKFIDSSNTTLSTQVGAGYRRLRPETLVYNTNGDGEVVSRVPLEQSNEGIGTAEVDFMHKFSPTTTFTNKYYMESGAMNTMLQDQLQLAVKMTTKLALTVGYNVIDNTNPPPPLKKIDRLTTLNLQFSF